MKELKSSMDEIRQSAGEFIEAMEEELQSIVAERTQEKAEEKIEILQMAMLSAGYRFSPDMSSDEELHFVSDSG